MADRNTGYDSLMRETGLACKMCVAMHVMSVLRFCKVLEDGSRLGRVLLSWIRYKWHYSAECHLQVATLASLPAGR